MSLFWNYDFFVRKRAGRALVLMSDKTKKIYMAFAVRISCAKQLTCITRAKNERRSAKIMIGLLGRCGSNIVGERPNDPLEASHRLSKLRNTPVMLPRKLNSVV